MARPRLAPRHEPGGETRVMAGKQKILIVDDDPYMRDIVTIHLVASGYEVTTASSGGCAVELIRTDRPDAVILDFAMPDLSGLEILRRIRAEADGEPLPVLMLTAWHSDEARIETQSLGARWMEKPVRGADLVGAIHTALEAS